MVLLDDLIYRETKDLILGKKQLPPITYELSYWMYEKYSVKMLNMQFNKLDNSERYRLYIILRGTPDFEKIQIDRFRPNPKYQNQITREFDRLVKKYNYMDSSKLSNLLVVFNDFSHEAKTEANWKAIKKAQSFIKQKYCDQSLWHVEALFDTVVVFYLSDSDIIKNNESGISEKIKLDYYHILKEYDELNYFILDDFVIKFDSKENLDKNYAGSLFYYSR